MLVAAPGQTATFSLHSSAAKAQLTGVNSTSTSTSSITVNGNSDISKSLGRSITGRTFNRFKLSENPITSLSTNNGVTAAAAAAAAVADISTRKLMKSLTGCLDQTTEFFKDTVQKVNLYLSNSNTDNYNSSPELTNESSNNKLFTLAPSVFHRDVEEYRSDDRNSVDNFHREMCHFRPILLAPVSPWKSSGNVPRRGIITVPKTVLGTAVKIEFNVDANGWNGVRPEANNDDAKSHNNENESLANNSNFQVMPKLRYNLFSPQHKSAFVSLLKAVHKKSDNVAPEQPGTNEVEVESKEVQKNNRLCRKPATSPKQIRKRKASTTKKPAKRSRNNNKKIPKTSAKLMFVQRDTTYSIVPASRNNSVKQPQQASGRNKQTAGPSVRTRLINQNERRTQNKSKKGSSKPNESASSPPLTRSRIRSMCKRKLTNALEYSGRYI